MSIRLDPAATAVNARSTLELVEERLDVRTLAVFAERYHVVGISLFGSSLRGEDRPDSDIDLLVEFEPGHTPGYLMLATMEAELAARLDGRQVDLRTAADLSRHFRDRVVREARPLHAR